MYKDLEYYNSDLNTRRAIMSAAKNAFDDGKDIGTLIEFAGSVVELGLRSISKYYPELIDSVIKSLSVKVAASTTSSDFIGISRIRSLMLTEPLIESRQDTNNFDLAADPTIGRRAFEDIGNETFSDRFAKIRELQKGVLKW